MNDKSNTDTSSSSKPATSKEPLVEQATHALGHVAGQAREQVEDKLDARKDQAVEAIGTVASAIRGTGEKLKGVGPLGDVAGRAADRIEGIGSFFEGKDLGQIVDEANRFARREPAIFLGAAFALGLIGGRFLKSSPRAAHGGEHGGDHPSFGAMEGARAAYARDPEPVTLRGTSAGPGATRTGLGATQAGTPATRSREPGSSMPATQAGGGAIVGANATTAATKPGSA